MLPLIPIITSLIGAKVAKDVVVYATTDQEQEGRELGIKLAARIYAPICQNLEDRQAKINAATDKEKNFFEEQMKLLKQQEEYYKQKVLEMATEIKKQSANKSAAVEKIVHAKGIGTGAISGGDFISVIGEALSLAWSVINFIDNEMEEKRSYYRKVEFEKQSRVWEEKIKEIRQKIAESIKNLKFQKNIHRNRIESFNESIQNISSLYDNVLKEYCEALAKYNILTEMKG